MNELSEEELQKAYLALMQDASLDKLELALSEPNIFSILAIDNMEIRHSNFLAWLLNPKENHGLNDLFLKRFLREIFFDPKIKEVEPLDAETLDYHQVEIRREWRNIDLLISFPDLVICIENKVRSKDNGVQLTNYKKIIEQEFPSKEIRKVYIYLTPYGSSSSHEREHYAFVSYREIIKILDRILEVYHGLISPQATYYIKDYIKSIKRNLMGSDSANILARKIYHNHKKLLDFIYANKPDYTLEFAKLIKGYLKNNGYEIGSKGKGYVRFLPKDLSPLISKNPEANGGWAKKEAFLFEFEFQGKNNLIFKATSAPAGANKAYKKKLSEIIAGIPGESPVQDKSWQVFFRKTLTVDIEDMIRVDPKKMPQEFVDFWEKEVLPIITKVKAVLKAHEDELLALKSTVGK